jgi:hypothetical protein
MKNRALVLALCSAVGLAAASAAWPRAALAFEVDTKGATNPDGSARYTDPDEVQLSAPLQQTGPDRNDYAGAAAIPAPPVEAPAWTYSSSSPYQRR